MLATEPTKDPVNALGKELVAHVEQITQRGPYRLFLEVRALVFLDRLVPLVAALLRHAVVDIGER